MLGSAAGARHVQREHVLWQLAGLGRGPKIGSDSALACLTWTSLAAAKAENTAEAIRASPLNGREGSEACVE